MKILDIKVYEGKNIYAFSPVVKMLIDLGEFTDKTTDQLGDFANSLIRTIPSLKEHYCSRGIQGGFVQRLQEGTLLGHVIEHVALELQELAGLKVIYGKTRSTDSKGIYEIVFEYDILESGVLAGRKAFEIVTNLLKGKVVTLEDIILELKESNDRWGLGPSTKAIVEAALRKNIPSILLDNTGLLQLGYGINQKRIGATITENTSCLAVDIASDKNLTKRLLYDAGIPVPEGVLIDNVKLLRKAFEELHKPLVIKPYNGNHGKGVSTRLDTYVEAEEAFRLAQRYSKQVIVEEHLAGEQYRILVVGDSVVAAAKRVPPFIVGDGIHTVKELIDRINSDPRRGQGHEKALTQIKIDEVVKATLTKVGLDLDSILPLGRSAILRESANLSTGAFSVDVTEELHPKNLEIAVRATSMIGLDVAGIDIIAKDIRRPISENNGGVIEVNAAPGLRMHLYPENGQARACGDAIVNHLFRGAEARIPIVSVTGTNGKTTTVRLVASILSAAGLKVGLTTTDGIYVDKQLVMAGDMAGPRSARALLKNPKIEAAVLETARGGIIKGGLGYDYSDVGIITNISADHLGQDGINSLEDLAYVKSLVIETVNRQGYAVLNADDPQVMKLVSGVRCKIIYFSSNSNNQSIKRHLGAGGKAIFIKKGNIVFAEANKVQKIAQVKELPVTLDGMAQHNIQNVLAATAAGIGLGINPRYIKLGLSSIRPTIEDNPGRLNIFELKDKKVIVDYGHNEAAYRHTIEILKKMPRNNLIGIIGVPGDRPDENIVEVGKISGLGFDRVFIKEDKELRGRKPGEVANLLRRGATESGLLGQRIKMELDEKEALIKAIRSAKKGDLVVIFYEKLEPIIKILEAEMTKTIKQSLLERRENRLEERNVIV